MTDTPNNNTMYMYNLYTPRECVRPPCACGVCVCTCVCGCVCVCVLCVCVCVCVCVHACVRVTERESE